MHGIAYIYKKFGGYRHFAQKKIGDVSKNVSRRNYKKDQPKFCRSR